MHHIPLSGRTGSFPSIESHLPARPSGSDEVVDTLTGGRGAEAKSRVVSAWELFESAMSAQMLRKVVLSTERPGTPAALVRPLLSVGPDVSLEVLKPLEWSLAKLESADEQLFALLKLVVRRDRLVPLAFQAQWTGLPFVPTLSVSVIPRCVRLLTRDLAQYMM